MFKKIIVSLFLICLLVAISIKLLDNSITHVTLGKPFLSFINQCSIELSNYKIGIPDIPKIEYILDVSEQPIVINNAWDAVTATVKQLDFFRNVVNAFITFINGFITILNFVILSINTIIQLLQFIFIILKNLITFRDTLVGNV